ncbi:SET domain-containing protein [Dictyobacter arantiisoli]|uniref:SET domain-containing protein n=1 Tax=Dictyobacter arantiisoli TaxID=2014874 RepID=A0A5A5TH17_9CHLR|nr:SET domain-containing protein [Dictyobacter arantiisoli]GCF10363.1 hypothetical protein KDI_39270 [Dictyobacter arantiisoli]
MLLPTVIVKPSAIDGHGLIATRDIPQGCVVWLPCPECRVWSEQELKNMSTEQAQWLDTYGYTLDNGKTLLPCHNAYQMNHSCEATTLDFGLDFCVAIRNIQAGEEVTCDYRTFSSDPPWTLTCHCNTPHCIGTFRSTDGYNSEVQRQWANKLEPILPLIRTVEQPLHTILMQASSSYRQIWTAAEGFVCKADVSIRRPSFYR